LCSKHTFPPPHIELSQKNKIKNIYVLLKPKKPVFLDMLSLLFPSPTSKIKIFRFFIAVLINKYSIKEGIITSLLE